MIEDDGVIMEAFREGSCTVVFLRGKIKDFNSDMKRFNDFVNKTKDMEKEVPIKGQQNKKERKWIFIVDLSSFTNLREIDLC
ncbi:21118_t:CDS:2, partial [Gigaspora rosea]